MKWFHYFSLILVSFGIGIVFTYWIQGQVFYNDVKNWIVGGSSFAVIIGLIYGGSNLFVTVYKERKEEKGKAMVNLKEHTHQLLPVLSKWAEEPLSPPTDYEFSFTRQHIATFNEALKDMLKDMDNTRQQCDGLQRNIPKYFRETIRTRVPTDFPELDADALHEIENDLMKSGDFVGAVHDPSANPIKYILQRQIAGGEVKRSYVVGTDEKVLPLAETLNDLRVDSHLKEMNENLTTLLGRLQELKNAFRKKVYSIIQEIASGVEEKDKILAGKCEKCRNIKDKWHIG